MMEDRLLVYDQVSIGYRGVPVVENVSFSLARGEILGIVGESGSGKTTLLKAAMGLLGRDGGLYGGTIWYRDRKLTDMSERELRGLCGPELAMVFQDSQSAFCPVRTVGAQMYEAVREHEKISRNAFWERAETLLDRMGLKDSARVLSSYPFELSGGMIQRVGIASAMFLNPGILFADEPTSALDVTVQKQAVDQMLGLREDYGTAIVIVTHNLGVVSAMADQILVLKDGKCVEYGTAEKVLKDPEDPYTRTLLEAVPRLKTGQKTNGI